MSDPVIFASSTPRFGLPLLHAGQAQKEFFVNQALALADGLLHACVEGETDVPPTEAQDGEAWLVGGTPQGDWTGHAGEIALRQSGIWLFATPVDGMIVHDRNIGQTIRFAGGWQRPAAPPAPSGGSTVDSEARAAISDLIDTLRSAGIFPPA